MAESNSTATATSRGASWLGLLGVVFVILKLNPGGYLDSPVQGWSWWLVLLPFYGGFVILLGIGLLFGGGYLVAKRIDKRNAKKREKERLTRRAARKPGDRYLGR